MKVSVRDHNGQRLEIAPNESYVIVEGAGAQVNILQDEGFLRITVDPAGRDFIGKLVVKGVYTHDAQAQLIVGGRKVGEGHPDEAISMAINEVDRIVSRMKRQGTASGAEVQSLSELLFYLRGLR